MPEKIKYKGFIPVRSERLWVISKDIPGPMPRELEGGFTSEKDALKAINLFQAKVRNNAKRTGSAKNKVSTE